MTMHVYWYVELIFQPVYGLRIWLLDWVIDLISAFFSSNI